MIDIDKCRTCLRSDKDMRKLNSSVTIGGEDIYLSNILSTFYKFQVDEDSSLPQNICILCVHQLTITYSFKLLIDNSQKALTENQNNTEAADDTNDHNYESEEDKEVFKTPPIPKSKELISPKIEEKLPTVNIRKNLRKVVYCTECRKKFQKIGALHDHYTKHHTRKSSKGRQCDYCGERMEELKALKLHRKKHLHPYVCDTCCQGFISSTDMENHYCITQQDKFKNKSNRQCDQCGKSYPPSYIGVHMKIHRDERPYHCKYCPKKFKVPGSLNSHILWNHQRTRNHICGICTATFISSSSRSTHIRKHHLKEKKYACKCGKRFFSKSELDRHDLTHTGAKNFHCHMCDKSYQTRHGLNVHLKSHCQISVMNL